MAKKIGIEDSFKELDKIVKEMDNDKCSLEKSMELYTKGTKLIDETIKKVDKIEKDLKILDV